MPNVTALNFGFRKRKGTRAKKLKVNINETAMLLENLKVSKKELNTTSQYRKV